jgi:hypothetical protein
MIIVVCPRCGSKNIRQGTIGNGVLTGYTSLDVCKDCGYRGIPIVFDSENEYKKFLREIPKTKRANKKQ